MTSAAIGMVLEGTKGNLKAERLILVNLSGTECHAWLAAMRDAGQPWHEELVDDLSMAKAFLQSQPQAHALICYDTPERQIANCIGKDRAPSQALANWMNQVEALLELYREHYHRITLVEQQALHNKPKALFEHLAVRSGIALGRVTPKNPEVTAEPDQSKQQQSAMQRLLALQALQHPPAQRLVEELEASSLPLLDSAELFDLLDSTHDILKQLPQGKAVAEGEDYHELKAKLEDVQQENYLVIEQLHKTQEELEQYLLGNRGVIQRTHSHGKAERELQKLKNSRSWRMTTPFRNFMEWLRGKKAWQKIAPLRKSLKVLLRKKGRKG